MINVSGKRNQKNYQQEAKNGKEELFSLWEIACFMASIRGNWAKTVLSKYAILLALQFKRSSKVILHIGRNNAGKKEAAADKVLDTLMDLKKENETTIPDCTVVLSTLMRRMVNRVSRKDH